MMGQAPVANFSVSTPTSGCSPLNVTFTDQSTGPITTWVWSFTNGGLAPGPGPINVNFGPGTWSATLTVIGPGGVSSITKTDIVTVYPSPTVGFTADNLIACLPANVQFTDHSVPNAGTSQSWLWNFGDNTTSTAQNPLHNYAATGYYNILLK